MNALLRSRFFVKQNVLLLLGLCLGVYFSYHALAGQRSLLALHRVQTDLQQARADLGALQQQNRALEQRVVMLRPETMDMDYVEELAVARLGYKRPHAMTVLHLSSR